MYDDAQDAVAAEYVLGTLSADEREHAEALLAIDPGFAEAVRVWERRLGELNVMVEAVEPPPAVWDRIKADIGDVGFANEVPPLSATAAPAPPQAKPAGGSETQPKQAAAGATLPKPATSPAAPVKPAIAAEPAKPSSGAEALSQVAAIAASLIPSAPDPETAAAAAEPLPAARLAGPPAREAKIERSADVIYLARRVGHWRRMAVTLGAIAALLAIFVAVTLFAPGLIPLGRFLPPQLVAGATAPPSGARLVGVLQQEPMSPAFLLTVDLQSRTLTVRRVSATAEPGRSYELWLISSRNSPPRSLGVVGSDEFTQRPIPSAIDIDAMRGASYAVSLEPAGGSKTGAPSGPILFTGKLVESLPAAATRS